MVDILKYLDSASKTHWVFNPSDCVEIRDNEDGSCSLITPYHRGNNFAANVPGTPARALKRSIQERVDEPLAFLKLHFIMSNHKAGNRYINIKHIHALTSRPARVDGEEVVYSTLIYGEHHDFKVDMEPGALAFQIRRVLKRLEQDEEICCEAPVEEESTEDA